MMAAAGAAARYAVPALMQAGAQFAAGKVGETVGGHNEQQSAQDRLKAQLMNENPNAQGQRGAESVENAKNSSSGRTRAEVILSNQLGQSNNRADLQNQMTAADQIIAANRGTQLADNYMKASDAQAVASGNVMSAIMNRPAQSYNVSGLR